MEHFDVTKRPVEYFEYSPMIEKVEKQFGQLMRMTRKLLYHQYRFALLHQFKEFERVV